MISIANLIGSAAQKIAPQLNEDPQQPVDADTKIGLRPSVPPEDTYAKQPMPSPQTTPTTPTTFPPTPITHDLGQTTPTTPTTPPTPITPGEAPAVSPDQRTPGTDLQAAPIEGELLPASPITQGDRAPAHLQVTPEMLTSEQLTKLLRTDNPYIMQARKRAEMAAGGRGLVNSSIAAGAAEAAAIDAGVKLATADAQRYYETALENVRSENEFGKLGIDQAFQIQKDYGLEATKIIGSAAQEIGQVLGTPGLNAPQQRQAVEFIEKRRDADLDALAALYTSLPSWSSAWDMIAGGTAPEFETIEPGGLGGNVATSNIESVIRTWTNQGGDNAGRQERLVSVTGGGTLHQWMGADGEWISSGPAAAPAPATYVPPGSAPGTPGTPGTPDPRFVRPTSNWSD